MSCGCKSSKANANVPEASFTPYASTHVFRAPGETTDCFMRRLGNTQSPVPPPNSNIKPDNIVETSIVADCDLKIDQQFTMSKGTFEEVTDTNDPKFPGSGYKDGPAKWSIAVKEVEGEPSSVAIGDIGLTFTESGKLSGTVASNYTKKKIKVEITAKGMKRASNTEETIDSMAYVFLAEKCDKDTLRLVQPLPIAEGRITGRFWERRDDHFHKGVDYAKRGAIGKIVAAADGVVKKVGPGTGYGNVIYIEHRNSSGKLMATTRYAHWSEAYVKTNDVVKAGQPIALEGNVGHSFGPHLHFELRLPDDTPVDPAPYFNGKVIVDTGQPTDPGQPSSSATVTEQSNRGLTPNEVDARVECDKSVPIGFNPNEPAVIDKQVLQKHNCQPPTPPGVPSKEEFLTRMNAKLDELGATPEDKQYFKNLALIECRYDAYATAYPLSSATGPFQMLNATAGSYYAKIGVEPTCENRCNIEYATAAQWKYFSYHKGIWTKYQATGQILKKTPPSNAHTDRYQSMPMDQFLYMLHHDGEGSVQHGNNLQGADIWRKNIRS